jgi:hypothetical protein
MGSTSYANEWRLINSSRGLASHRSPLAKSAYADGLIHRPATSEYSFFADTFQAMAKDITGGAEVKTSVAKATTALDARLSAN